MQQTIYSWLAMSLLIVGHLSGQSKTEIPALKYFFIPHAVDSLSYQSNQPNGALVSMVYRSANNHFLQQSTNASLRQNLVSDTRQGILISALGFGHDQQIAFPNPITMVPSHIQLGDRYTKNEVFDYGGALGMLSLEVRILGYDFADTPLQNFHQCLVVLVRMKATLHQGPKLFERTTKGWYYPEVGLVKMALKESVNQKAPTQLTLSLKSLKYRGAWKESLHGSETDDTPFIN